MNCGEAALRWANTCVSFARWQQREQTVAGVDVVF